MAQQQVAAETIVPLRFLMKEEIHLFTQRKKSNLSKSERELILKKTAVAYGISRALIQLIAGELGNRQQQQVPNVVNLDNVSVRFANHANVSERSWKDITGVDLMSPNVSVPLTDDLFGDIEDETDSPQNPSGIGAMSGQSFLYFFGILMYELFSRQLPFFSENEDASPPKKEETDEPKRKKRASAASWSQVAPPERDSCHETEWDMARCKPLLEFGIPSSLSYLVEKLLASGRENGQSDSAYSSMSKVCVDLRLAIQYPNLFLFHHVDPSSLKNGNASLKFRGDKLYGRGSETNLITEAFRRVSRGRSEALFIGGVSGSGKTRLVQSVMGSIRGVGAYVVSKKIDLMEQEAFTTVLSAFNALILEIKESSSPQQLQNIGVKLMIEFSTDFSLLVQLLPNIRSLFPQINSEVGVNQGVMQVDGVIFILQRFIRVISSKEHPVVLCLDDLHWSDDTALNLIDSILSSDSESGCVFFVGNFRSNQVDPDHEIHDLIKSLQARNVKTTSMELGGIGRSDLNTMVSDALYLFPSITFPLSDVVFQRTNGNPFFARQSLKSLVENQLLSYNLRENRWTWDLSNILSIGLSDDVLGLLSLKIRQLGPEMQAALKMLSLTTKISDDTRDLLGTTSQYPNLSQCLDEAAKYSISVKFEGYFSFIHDKVQEAVLSLIPIEDRERCHFDLAVLLYSVSKGNRLDNVLFIIVDQFLKCPSFLEMKHSFSINIPELFGKATSKALKTFDFPRALKYSRKAASLLHEQHWDSQNDLCTNVFYQLARSSNACGNISEAKDAIQKILVRGGSLQQKENAYSLIIDIFFARNELESAFSTCLDVLSLLNQQPPNELDPGTVQNTVNETSARLASVPDSVLVGMQESDETTQSIIKFYGHLAMLSFFFKPRNLPIYTSKIVDLTLQNGVSVHSALGLVLYGTMLCNRKIMDDSPTGLRAGKLAMNFQQRFIMTDQLPCLHLWYHGFVAEREEPFQTSSQMHINGFQIGMSIGNSAFGLMNAIMGLRVDLLSGENLQKLKKKTDYYLRLASKHSHSMSISFMTTFRETLLVLIGNGDLSWTSSNSSSSFLLRGKSSHLHSSIRCFFLRHHDRFEYFYKLFLEATDVSENTLLQDFVVFLRGVNALQSRKGMSHKRTIGNESLKELAPLVERSRWNYEGKEHILKAELFSFQHRNKEAEDSYDSAIESSRRSKFVHEEGLACELAGFHYVNVRKPKTALLLFTRAKKCYSAWGSQLKVDFVSNEISKIESKQSIS